MATLRDVALAAGVSTSTASRVLDERLPPSRTAAADRVRQAAADLGYVRDPLAAGLRRSGTSTIGVVVPRLTDTVMAMLYEEIAAGALARGLFAVVATTHDRPEAERLAVESLLRRRVDGIIRTTARTDAPLRIDESQFGARQVLALRADGIHSTSIGDDTLGGYLATRKLIDHGHRRIGLVMGPGYATTATNRRDGYRNALVEAGIPLDDALIVGDSFSMEAGESAAHALLDLADPPTAIFAVNDNNAIGVMAAAAARGLRIPDDLSVIGYNDIPVVSKLPVPLTTIREPFNLIARGAIDLLLEDTPGDEPRTLVATPTLIPRKSTAAPRAR
ncbi:LacI family DNA-binding transcriptional regulator [Nakamurella multipartita]|uniref:Transcriptional regulator, LacI family n=1 Tax=Nakamurella multipartita (strain ATCC 700099 / DSM 44233 / CIP 104796 / JCM 9543 / NBRC 105858 / Y-104) TaxID=479431 RepID=C8X839_NAKMY|nr:LacI family DNA-binding transcriptional regulator [Nakamurella multipartita]ACV77015.1 transcriptional regulator, LacI family [Nakamurella multipartita DSM 44233]